MFVYSSYEAENKSQYLTPKWQLKILRPWPLLFKGQGHFDKNGAKIHKYFSYMGYLKWIFTGELVWIVVIEYQTFFPVIQFQKMLSTAVSKKNEGQGQRSKGTTVIMT